MNRKVWLRVSNVFSFSLVLLQLSTISGRFIERNAVCESEGCVAAAVELKKSIDVTVDPCDDFYQYACGNWPKSQCKTEKCDYLDKFDLRDNQNREEIIEFLKQENSKDEPEAVHKARKFYSMCLNRASYKGVDKVKNMLVSLGLPIIPQPLLQNEKTSASSKCNHATLSNSTFDYIKTLAKMTRIAGIQNLFFSIVVDVNPYNHNENLISLSTTGIVEPTLSTILKEQMMKALCEDEKLSHDEITCTFNLTENQFLNSNASRQSEMKLLKVPPEISPSPVFYTLEELQKISDGIADELQPSISKLNFTSYLEELFSGVGNVTLDLRNASKVQLVVQNENLVRYWIELLHMLNIDELEYVLWKQVVSDFLPYASWEVFNATLTDKNSTSAEKEEGCYYMVTFEFAQAISYMYLKKDHTKHAKVEIEEMIDFMKEDLKTELEQALWIDEETRERALKKLALMKLLTAYPDPKEFSSLLSQEYDDIIITDSMAETLIELSQKKMNKNLNKLNEPGDSTIDLSLLIMVNAFSLQDKNSLVIPAAILDWPMYIQSLKAFTYGSIGTVLGHEITHGFDNLGRKFNEFGEREDWWRNDTLIKFTERAECFKEVYSGYETKFHGVFQKINSTFSLGDDIADNGGFKRALHAYRSYVWDNGEEPALVDFENLTHEQLFTLGFANIWCEYPTQEHADQVAKFDVHSPGPTRINGVFKNSEEFAEIWNCPKGSEMNPEKKCSLW